MAQDKWCGICTEIKFTWLAVLNDRTAWDFNGNYFIEVLQENGNFDDIIGVYSVLITRWKLTRASCRKSIIYLKNALRALSYRYINVQCWVIIIEQIIIINNIRFRIALLTYVCYYLVYLVISILKFHRVAIPLPIPKAEVVWSRVMHVLIFSNPIKPYY